MPETPDFDQIEQQLAEILNDFGLTVDPGSCHPGAAVVFKYEDGTAWARCAVCRRRILCVTVDVPDA
jgi:hypothetical protein